MNEKNPCSESFSFTTRTKIFSYFFVTLLFFASKRSDFASKFSALGFILIAPQLEVPPSLGATAIAYLPVVRDTPLLVLPVHEKPFFSASPDVSL